MVLSPCWRQRQPAPKNVPAPSLLLCSCPRRSIIFFYLGLDISFSFSKFPRGIPLRVEGSNYESYVLLSTLWSLSLCYFQHLLCLWLLFKNLEKTHLWGIRGWRKWCSHLVTKVVFMLLLWGLWFLFSRVAQSGSPGCLRMSKDREKHLHMY